MKRARWECPRRRKACRPGHLCSGCKFAAKEFVRLRLVEATAVYCNQQHPNADFRCDRAPHEGRIHRNAVQSLMWYGTPSFSKETKTICPGCGIDLDAADQTHPDRCLYPLWVAAKKLAS